MIAVTVKQLSAEIIGGFMPFMWTLFKYLQMRPSSISMQVASELRSGLFANVCIQALTHRTHSCIALHNLWTTDAWLLSRNCQLSFTPQGFSDIININCYFFFHQIFLILGEYYICSSLSWKWLTQSHWSQSMWLSANLHCEKTWYLCWCG